MKKTLVMLLAVIMLVSCIPAFAVTLENVEVAVETVAAEETGALSAGANVPGLNVFTGTTEPETMDTMPAVIIGHNAINNAYIHNDNGNNVYLWTITNSVECYPQMVIDMKLENGRKYYYRSNTKRTGENKTTDVPYWLMYDNASPIAVIADSGFVAAWKTGSWYTTSVTVTPTKDNPSVAIQLKSVGASGSAPGYYFFDDLMLVPYYKITYVGLDGETVVKTVDYLFADDKVENGIATFYVPDYDAVEGATGYSLTPDGAAVSSVMLANADITLYARNDVNTGKAVFTSGNEKYEATVTGDKFILPYNTTTDFNVAEGKYLILWDDGENQYYPGDVLAASDVIGKEFKAVINDFAVFDEKKGYLLFFVDYETGDVSASGGYVNPRYKRTDHNAGNWRTRTDGVANVSLFDDGGNKVRKDVSQTQTHHLTGHIYDFNRNVEDIKGAKVTTEFDFKYIDGAAANYTGGFIRMCYYDISAEYYYNKTPNQYPGQSSTITNQVKDKTDGEMNHASLTMEDTLNNGFNGGIVQFSKTGTASTVYFDNWKAWALPDSVAFFKSSKTAEDWVKFPVDKSKETFTMPYPEDTGFDIAETFHCWTDGKTLYEAGKAYALDIVEHKMFYPFYQDASTPAVISLYEGDVDKSVAKTKLTQPVVDDGRTVLLVSYWGDTWNGTNKVFDSDPRMSLTASARFDASVYNIIATNTKVDASYKADDNKNQNTTTTANTTGAFRIFNYINSNYSYNADSSIENWSQSVDGKYHHHEIDMANQSASAKYPWVDTGYGFAFDVICANYGGECYVDYVRIYKDGINTVTYATNAPAGATVVKEVAADTGRGLGTGYLLKGERPEVTGYKFMGWALAPDATAADVIESFDFTADTTVYAVWAKDNGAIDARANAEMRFGDTTTGSIRFKADALADQRDDAAEYGFIVARKSHLTAYGEALTHNFINRKAAEVSPLYVEGIAYKKGEIDTVYEKDENTGDVVFTAACVNIPLNTAGVNDKLVARPYYKYAVNGKTVYVYGTVAEASLGDVASSVDTESSDYLNNKAYLDGIIGLIEG